LHSDSTVPFHSLVGAGLASPASPHLGKILVSNIFDRAEFLSAPVLGGEGNHTRPTLKIQDGCDSRCSYCVIPFVRGKSRSLRPALPYASAVRLQPNPRRHAPLVSRRALCPPRRTDPRTPPACCYRRRRHYRFPRRNRRRSCRYACLHRAPSLHLSPRFLFLE